MSGLPPEIIAEKSRCPCASHGQPAPKKEGAERPMSGSSTQTQPGKEQEGQRAGRWECLRKVPAHGNEERENKLLPSNSLNKVPHASFLLTAYISWLSLQQSPLFLKTTEEKIHGIKQSYPHPSSPAAPCQELCSHPMQTTPLPMPAPTLINISPSLFSYGGASRTLSQFSEDSGLIYNLVPHVSS